MLENLDFQQEKQAEMMSENDVDVCTICGEILHSKDIIYQKADEELVHTRCVFEMLNEESMEYGEYTCYRRDNQSTEEIF